MTETAGAVSGWGFLERWSPRLFLLGGVLVLGSALYNGLRFFAGASLPEATALVLNMAGFVVALVAAVGFYPTLSSRTPRLARLSLAIAAGGIIGILVLAAWAVAMLGFSVPDPSPVVALLSLLLMLVGLCLFGVAILRTDAYPVSVGALLLALVAALIVVFARSVVIGGDPSDVFIVVMEGVEGMFLLGIGYFLRTSPAPARREGPSPA